MFAIQKNLSAVIPKAIRAKPKVKRIYPFAEMEVGDFFFVPNREKNILATQASTMSKRLKRRYRSRLIYAKEVAAGWEVCNVHEPGAVLGIGVFRDE